MAIRCIHCGTELPGKARFCMTCGKPPREAVAASDAQPGMRSSDEAFTFYGQPPFTAAKAVPPGPRKSHRFRWIALGLVTLVLLGGVGGFVYTMLHQTGPTEVLQAACAAYERGDKQAIAQMLTPDFQQQSNADLLYVAADPQANRARGGIVDCSVTGVTQHGIVAAGVTVITYGNGGSKRVYLQLVEEHVGWKINNVVGVGENS